MMNETKQVLIFGATGNVGGAAARELLKRGWQVRAATRDPQGDKAQALAGSGAEVVQADMDDRASLEAAFEGIKRVFSVQSWVTSGVEGEIRQGKAVAEAAKAAGIEHLVYGSAGIGEAESGVPHFDCKVEVERAMRDGLGLPTTAVRPGPFMELMTDKGFFPPMVAWGAMPKVVGWDTPVPWTAVADIGATIANVFENPEKWIGRDINLIGDQKSLRGCKAAIKAAKGKRPFGLPIPVAIFNRMVGPEFEMMWRWLVDWMAEDGEQMVETMMAESLAACPELHSVERWLASSVNGSLNGNGRIN
jgi:uncharacterized protein YbjT (DUF2867 family)